MEKLIGVIKNVQVKPAGCMVKKSSDLYITDKRIICIVLGQSVFISTLVGQAIAGIPGAMAFAVDSQGEIDKKREESVSSDLDEMISKNEFSFDINYENIDSSKSTYKTGFFSTFGIFAQIRIVDNFGNVSYLDTPNNTKETSKKILSLATEKITVS